MQVVTGAAGFIGAHLVRALAAEAVTVAAVDRLPMPPGTADVVVQADLADPCAHEVDELLRAADVVYHLAGCPGVRGTGSDIQRRRHRDNVVAGRRVLDRTPPATHVIVTSSSSVYGGARDATGAFRPCRETDRLRPAGGYARSKAALERACAARAARGGRVAVSRPFTVLGEGQRPDMAVASWLDAVERGRPLTVLGALTRVRDVTDVRDVVRGLRAIAQRGVETTVNLGTGTGRTLAEIVAAVGAVTGIPASLVLLPAGPEEAAATLADPTRCRRLLGFAPRTDVTDVVRRQAEHRMQARRLLETA